MDINLILKGMVIGFAIAAPVGPIGVLCIRRSLINGWKVGVATGLGAATADAIYGCVAALGLTILSDLLVNQQSWFKLIGGAFLIYLGIKSFLSKPSQTPAETKSIGLIGAYLSTWFLTITNPMTILSFIAIFAGVGLASSANITGLWLVLGVFCGSLSWWLMLSGGISLVRNKFKPAGLIWVNRISGLIIIAFGIGAIFTLLVDKIT
jgi:threonine/homoserine/homoserine lactone efflux protein